MDIQVFESDRFFFLRFSHVSSPFFLEDGDGRKKINPKIHKKAIVIGNQMINYWMFQHFPSIFQHFPMDFPMDFPSRDHPLDQGRSHGGLLRLQLP
jgi:hypothetical protein